MGLRRASRGNRDAGTTTTVHHVITGANHAAVAIYHLCTRIATWVLPVSPSVVVLAGGYRIILWRARNVREPANQPPLLEGEEVLSVQSDECPADGETPPSLQASNVAEGMTDVQEMHALL